MNEIVHITLVISMLSIATLFDLKTRTINDVIWIIFATIGFTTNMFLGYVGIKYLIIVGICVLVSLLCKRMKIIATADMLCIITLSVIITEFNNVKFISLLITMNAFVLSFFYVIITNVLFNLKDLTKHSLFYEIDESFMKKIFAIFYIHKKKKFEKFIFPGITEINGKKKFVFSHDPDTQYFKESISYVRLAVPLMPFLLLASVFTIILLNNI